MHKPASSAHTALPDGDAYRQQSLFIHVSLALQHDLGALSRCIMYLLSHPTPSLTCCAAACAGFAAASPEEFALLPRLLGWHQRGLLWLQLHTTQSHELDKHIQTAAEHQQPQTAQLQRRPPHQLAVQQGRIDFEQLQKALQELHKTASNIDAYVCGPPQMTDEVVGSLEKLGLPSSCIRTEKWW